LGAFDRQSRPRTGPYVVIAHTVKGKGISFIENNAAWHHNRLSQSDAAKALAELGFCARNGEG
jgi:transketolase